MYSVSTIRKINSAAQKASFRNRSSVRQRKYLAHLMEKDGVDSYETELSEPLTKSRASNLINDLLSVRTNPASLAKTRQLVPGTGRFYHVRFCTKLPVVDCSVISMIVNNEKSWKSPTKRIAKLVRKHALKRARRIAKRFGFCLLFINDRRLLITTGEFKTHKHVNEVVWPSTVSDDETLVRV